MLTYLDTRPAMTPRKEDEAKGLQQFSFQAEITEDLLLTTGQKIQVGKSAEGSVRRPNRMRAEALGDADNRLMIYDGKTIPVKRAVS